MKKIIISIFSIILLAGFVTAQTEKGVDTQTKSIRKETKINGRTNDAGGRSWTWGKGKTKVRKQLQNPYPINARRDILIKNIVFVLKDNKLIVDESASQLKDGLIVTKPRIFSKGTILTKTELNRYAVVPATNQVWSRGRYSLTIDVQSIDGIRNKVSVLAKVEGKSENGIFSEWSKLRSSGVAEDEFLTSLVESLGGDTSNGGRKP